jgi:hypothetical protein
MTDYKKFVAVPAEMSSFETQPVPEFTSTETQTTGFRRRRERSTYDKSARWAKIILKLASINGFDDQLRIKREDNTFVSNSNVIALVNHTLTQAKILTGLPELIKQLHNAHVDPELVINERVKAELYSLINRNTGTQTDVIPYNFGGNDNGNTRNETSVKRRIETPEPSNDNENAQASNRNVNQRKRRLNTVQELDSSLGVGSSKEKLRRIDNEPTDIANSNINWDTNEEEEEIPDASLPYNVNLPDDDTDDL